MKGNDTVQIIDSTINETAQLHDFCTVIKSYISEGCILGKSSRTAYSSLGLYSYTADNTIVLNSEIGKFCSISWGVSIGPEDHDYKRLTSHSFLYSTKSFQLTPHKHYSPFERPCSIGNDVWVGCNATILRGVTIGDGAVVGANSLVNKDVPPYAIVAGNPAKVIKFRFPEDIIGELILLKWWDMPLSVIKEHTDLFAAEPTMEIIKKIKLLARD